jgi:peptidyl-prolyl cis-trans isomerase D
MINSLKNITKKKLAGLILILVIIIAFGFGGFGGGFSTGNQNNIVKISNKNITTQDFMDYLNQSGLSQEVIKSNIDKNIIEELLSTLISTSILNFEIKDLDLTISENILAKKIKKNRNFQDENGKFQRILYEKFMLENNMTSAMFEIRLKNKELQKQLFTYISGGIKNPTFIVSKHYKEKNKKVDIDYINLNKFYKKIDDFSETDIQKFVNENSDRLKKDFIDFSYIVITPKNLVGIDEFNQAFFDKIDDIENKISKNIDFKTIVAELDITPILVNDYINLENNQSIENKIYNSRNNKTEILEDKNSYIFYQINNVNSKLPNNNDEKFKLQIKNLLFQKAKFEFNKNILEQINKNEFNQISFDKLGINNIEKIKLNSIKDDSKFEINSVEILYSLPINSFTLITDDKENVYIAKIINYVEENISQGSNKFIEASNDSSSQNRNTVLKSYDYLLNSKYKVVVNEKTLDRVKNYFR